MKYIRELEYIDTANKSYLLGLIYSDGSIIYKPGISYCCRIKLNDKDVLENISKLFPFFCNPKTDQGAYLIYCYSKQLVLDLKAHGLVESKSIKNVHLLKNPGVLCYPGDFIRGVFDGDGNVYVDKNNNKRISICTNSKAFVNYIAELYNQFGIKYSIVSRKNRNLFSIKIGAQKSIKAWVKLTHPNNSLYMPRKWDTINSFKWKDLKAIKSAAVKNRYKPTVK